MQRVFILNHRFKQVSSLHWVNTEKEEDIKKEKKEKEKRKDKNEK